MATKHGKRHPGEAWSDGRSEITYQSRASTASKLLNRNKQYQVEDIPKNLDVFGNLK